MTTQNNHKRSRIPMEMVLKDVEFILGNFGVILGTIWGQFVAPNSKLSQNSHVTTQNDRGRSRIQMEIVLRLNLKKYMSF